MDQVWLLPPSAHDFVPAGHPAHLVRELVRAELDLTAILAEYEREERGPSVAGGVCATWLQASSQGDAAKPAARQTKDGAGTIAFDTRMPCIDTGLWLEAGHRYIIDVTDVEGWRDGSCAAGADGLSGLNYLLDPAYLGGIPARRDVCLPWFTLVGEIGRDSGHTFPLNRNRVILKPLQSGRLYLYVNDAINPGLELADLNVADADGLPITPAERQSGRSSVWYAIS